MAVLAAILFVVAANMGEWHEIPVLLRQTKTDIAVWVTTFALTVFADLTVAVEVGIILAALLYVRRVAATTTVDQVTEQYLEEGRVHILQGKEIPDYVTILRIHGPFLFGVDRQAAGRHRSRRRSDADRRRPTAQHDGDRRDRVSARSRI